jgi:uncharacterized protein YjiS (DUF1127 family)
MQYSLRLIILPAGPRVAGMLSSALDVVAVWRQRSRTRQHLAGLDAHALADVGFSSAQQRAEAAKWFWQP